jgi:GntR family transcriptional regulator, rspAB operon transcriptional repressor
MDDRPISMGMRDSSMRGAALVLETLRQEILSLALPPGTALSRPELQSRFGLSSTPVRDALMRLQEEGLVDIFPQHATIVSQIDVAGASQAQFLRRSIEIEAVRTLALAPDATLIARLRSLIRQQSAFAELGEYEAFTTADQAFHRALYDALRIGALWYLMRRQSGHIDRLRRLNLPVAGKMHEIILAHTAIVDAVEAGKPEAAQEALRQHLSRSLQFVDKLRDSHPQYFRT